MATYASFTVLKPKGLVYNIPDWLANINLKHWWERSHHSLLTTECYQYQIHFILLLQFRQFVHLGSSIIMHYKLLEVIPKKICYWNLIL